MLESNIAERDITHTVMQTMRRDSTNGHAYSKIYKNIFYSNIFCALGNLTSLMCGLDCNSIIMTGNCHVSDNDICSWGVNTVSVQRISRDADTTKSQIKIAELLLELSLLVNIDVNFKVLQQEIVHVIEWQVIWGRILILNSFEKCISYTIELEKPGSASLIKHHVFTHPPPIATTID